jgi:purine operon repressor
METKGIPMALMTAKAMNLPLVIIRKDAKVSEGPTLSMTYMSGSSKKVESMTLPRKALKQGSKVILIDDFMRGGGTIKGMTDLMNEFDAKVIATGVFISTKEPEDKMVKDYVSLLELQRVDEINNKIEIQANIDVLNSIMEKKDDKE